MSAEQPRGDVWCVCCGMKGPMVRVVRSCSRGGEAAFQTDWPVGVGDDTITLTKPPRGSCPGHEAGTNDSTAASRSVWDMLSTASCCVPHQHVLLVGILTAHAGYDVAWVRLAMLVGMFLCCCGGAHLTIIDLATHISCTSRLPDPLCRIRSCMNMHTCSRHLLCTWERPAITCDFHGYNIRLQLKVFNIQHSWSTVVHNHPVMCLPL